jgi:GDP-L-fucose synthase
VLSAIGYRGRLEFDSTKPDGTPRKLLDVTRLTDLGWKPRISLENGIARTYAWFKEHSADARL